MIDRADIVAAATTALAAELLIADGCPPDLAPQVAAQERGEAEGFDVILADGRPYLGHPPPA